LICAPKGVKLAGMHPICKICYDIKYLQCPCCEQRTRDPDSHGLIAPGLEPKRSSCAAGTVWTKHPPRTPSHQCGHLFLRQFLSPLIYILLLAAVVSLMLQEISDAAFIFAVLLINALIGTVQEYSAERSAEALRRLITTHVQVLREGEAFEISAQEIVPGHGAAGGRPQGAS